MKNLILIFLAVCFISCSKDDRKILDKADQVKSDISKNQIHGGKQYELLKQWTGIYEFSESANSLNGANMQSWDYIVNVSFKDDNTLTASLNIDGFQTATRIEADVKATEKTAEFIFNKYGTGNMFEVYRNGDKLFSFELNDNKEIVMNWNKLKPNLPDSRKNGTVMFRKTKPTT